MINLNEINDKKELNKENLLKFIKDIDIYRFYLQSDLDMSNRISSPFRKDKNPSFGFFIKKDEILFNDFVVGGGDCIKFVQKLFNLNFNDALCKIAIDFQLQNKLIIPSNISISPSNNIKEKVYTKTKGDLKKEFNSASIKIKIRKWKHHDKKYWQSFGISLFTLKHYNVYPISYIFLQDNIIRADKYAYAYVEKKDNKLTYKIYQPFSKTMKWLSNIDYSVWQGWTQLPKKGKTLIITKSLKDIMCMVENTSYYGTGLQNEKVLPKENVITELKNSFDNIFVLYDNDFNKDTNWGRKYGEKIAELIGCKQLEIPTYYKCTDISEFYKKYGKQKTNNLLDNLIELSELPF